jgi:cell division transport system permease protein
VTAAPLKVRLGFILSLLRGDPQADRSVPPTGYTARLTTFTAAAMALLAVFALALSLATDRMADRWSSELAQTATIRISAPPDQTEAQTRAALRVLDTTPGIASARALTAEEQRALLAPWFGADLPLDTLPIPQLIEIVEGDPGYDSTGLRARLLAEVPGATLDDHARWREPLVAAANRVRLLGLAALVLIVASTAAMITLAAQAALFANAQVIRVLRLVGARDIYIARAFVRRFTLRALTGAAIGSALGMTAIAFLPSSDVAGGFLTGLGFSGSQWLLPLLVPPAAAATAFFATRAAALRSLRGQS